MDASREASIDPTGARRRSDAGDNHKAQTARGLNKTHGGDHETGGQEVDVAVAGWPVGCVLNPEDCRATNWRATIWAVVASLTLISDRCCRGISPKGPATLGPALLRAVRLRGHSLWAR